MREAVPGRRAIDRHLVAHALQQLQHAVPRGVVGAVQLHVEQRELQLAHGEHAALEIARGEHALEQVARQRCPGLHVRRHRLHARPFPAEVLHELAGQLHRVPLHAVDAGNAQLTHAGQQLMQAMAHFMEQRGDFVVPERRRLAVAALAEVAHQIDQRRLRAAGAVATVAAVIHPGAAALSFAGIQVEIELADQAARRIHQTVETHVRMPDRRAVRLHAQAVQRVDQVKQAGQHLRLGEVRFHFLLGEAVAGLLELLAHIGQIPGFQCLQAEFVTREDLQFLAVAPRMRQRAPGQVAQESQHFGGIARHLGGDGVIGIAGEAQQRGQLAAQGEDTVDVGTVVQRRIAELRGALSVGAIQRGTQVAVIGIGLHRQVARHLQGQLPAGAAVLLGRGARGGAHFSGQARQARFVLDVQRPGVGRIEHVLGELRRQRGQRFLDRREALLASVVQFGAAETEITQRVVDDLAPRGVVSASLRRGGQLLVLRVQRQVLSQRTAEARHLGQVGVVGLTQRRGVHHRLQMAHLAPGPPQALGGVVQRHHEAVPGDWRDLLGLLHRGLGLGQQLVDGGRDMLGRDGIEARQAGEIEQRVVHGDSNRTTFTGYADMAVIPARRKAGPAGRGPRPPRRWPRRWRPRRCRAPGTRPGCNSCARNVHRHRTGW